MGDANPIRTLRDYSKPSHEGYRNTIELPVGNNVCEIDRVAGGKLRDKNADESWEIIKDLALYDHEGWNDSKEFVKPVKANSLLQDVPSTSDHRLIELENQVQTLDGSPSCSDATYSSEQNHFFIEICSGPHDTQYRMENPEQAFKTISEKLDDTPIRNTAGNPASQMNFTSTNDPIREELRGNRIKSLSKLLSPKYLSQSSLAEQNRNPSSPKRVHFDHEMTVESEEESEEETKDEIEEKEEDSPKNFNTFPTMKELRLHYNWIMNKRLGPRRKPSNPRKIYNFVGKVKGLKVFVGNLTYECDFMVLKDATSVIDHDLGSVVFGKPFVEATRLVYDMEEGTITFEKDKEKIVFKMPHKMEMFKHIDFTDIKTDRIPPFVIESDDDSSRKTHYSDSLDLGTKYKHDENVCRSIQRLIAMKAKRNKGEVT
ncbi:MAK10-like protein [Tanacetum coccineum]